MHLVLFSDADDRLGLSMRQLHGNYSGRRSESRSFFGLERIVQTAQVIMLLPEALQDT